MVLVENMKIKTPSRSHDMPVYETNKICGTSKDSDQFGQQKSPLCTPIDSWTHWIDAQAGQSSLGIHVILMVSSCTGPRGYFFMLKSAEQEISTAHKKTKMLIFLS